MLFLGIDQHARQLTVSLRDQNGNVILARQVSTQPDKILDFFDQLTHCCAQRQEPFIAGLEVCGFNDWLIRMLQDCRCPFGSVDRNSFSATDCGVSNLRQTGKRGCSPGCRNDRHSLTDGGVECHDLDLDLKRVIEAWPHLSTPIKAALMARIGAATAT